jgi:YfiH family protein
MPVITKKVGQLEYLVSENIPVRHCFTTRFGGVSSGHLESLNIGIHRDDAWQNVLKNYDILGNALGFDPKKLVLSHQTHTDIVLRVGMAQAGAGLFAPEMSECDALITNEPGVGLVIFTADCTPILLHDPVTGAVGAAHAGWRGTAAEIAGKTVTAMTREFGCDPANIRAAIGPNIGQCCFATDADVPTAMGAAFGSAVEPYIRQVGEKYYVNLKEINALVLRRAGVRQIDISRECTACVSHRFWSHRITKGLRGSQGAIIVCEEGRK